MMEAVVEIISGKLSATVVTLYGKQIVRFNMIIRSRQF